MAHEPAGFGRGIPPQGSASLHAGLAYVSLLGNFRGPFVLSEVLIIRQLHRVDLLLFQNLLHQGRAKLAGAVDSGDLDDTLPLRHKPIFQYFFPSHESSDGKNG